MSTPRKKEHSISEVTLKQALESQKDSVSEDAYTRATAEYDSLVKICQRLEKHPRFKDEVKEIKEKVKETDCSSRNAPYGDKWPNLYTFLRTTERRLDVPTNIALWRKYTYMTSLKAYFDQRDISAYEEEEYHSLDNSRESSTVKQKSGQTYPSNTGGQQNSHPTIEHNNSKSSPSTARNSARGDNSTPTNNIVKGIHSYNSEKRHSVPHTTNGTVQNRPLKLLESRVQELEDKLREKEKLVTKKEQEVQALTREKNRKLSERDSRIEELTSRLIKQNENVHQTANSPVVTEITDNNSPEKLGEYFSALSEDEWSEAFEAMKEEKKNEDEILQTLFDIVMGSYEFCHQLLRTKQQQIESSLVEKLTTVDSVSGIKPGSASLHSLKVKVSRTAKDLIKTSAQIVVPSVCKAFKQKDEKYKRLKKDTRVEKYVDKCVRLTWLMCVLDPPMTLSRAQVGDVFHTDAFTYYEKNGTKVKICVWPALYLHDGGPLIRKGSVYPK